MKNLFLAEINKIKDEKLKTASLKMVDNIPEYFWHEPASSSGKYHPECDLGDGGLVRHSIMVSRVADDLVTAEMFCRDNQSNRDIVKVATLFHDSIKHGLVSDDGTYSNHTVFEHPLLSTDFVRTHLEEADIDIPDLLKLKNIISKNGYDFSSEIFNPQDFIDEILNFLNYKR